MNSTSMPVASSPVANQIQIAFPMKDSAFCAHFGGASHFRIITAERGTGRILEQTEQQAPEHVPGAFPQWLARQGIQAVIVGSIGKRALQLFAAQGIAVYGAAPNAPVEELAKMQAMGLLQQTNLEECCPGHAHADESHCHSN